MNFSQFVAVTTVSSPQALLATSIPLTVSVTLSRWVSEPISLLWRYASLFFIFSAWDGSLPGDHRRLAFSSSIVADWPRFRCCTVKETSSTKGLFRVTASIAADGDTAYKCSLMILLSGFGTSQAICCPLSYRNWPNRLRKGWIG